MSPRARRLATIGCAVGAVALLAAPVVALVNAPEQGADSPEAAVRAVVDAATEGQVLDAVRFVDPDDLADVEALVEAFQSGDIDYVKVDAEAVDEFGPVTDLADEALQSGVDEETISALAAFEVDVDGLEVEAGDAERGQSLVLITDGEASVTLDPDRLPVGWQDRLSSDDEMSHRADVATGWELDGRRSPLMLMTVQRNGRWYVSFELTRALLAGELDSADPDSFDLEDGE